MHIGYCRPCICIAKAEEAVGVLNLGLCVVISQHNTGYSSSALNVNDEMSEPA